MQVTVTNMQVALKYWHNVSSLSIDMLADDRTTTLGWHIDRHIGWLSVHISNDARLKCRSICRPIHQPSVGRFVDRNTLVKECTKYTWSHLHLPTIFYQLLFIGPFPKKLAPKKQGSNSVIIIKCVIPENIYTSPTEGAFPRPPQPSGNSN